MILAIYPQPKVSMLSEVVRMSVMIVLMLGATGIVGAINMMSRPRVLNARWSEQT